MTTMITAGTVVTANSRMQVWQPGYMIVRESRIAEAGPGPGPDCGNPSMPSIEKTTSSADAIRRIGSFSSIRITRPDRAAGSDG